MLTCEIFLNDNALDNIFVNDTVNFVTKFYLILCQGYLVNWEIEKQIWDYLFGRDGLKVSTGDKVM